jgi:hypothetical protein
MLGLFGGGLGILSFYGLMSPATDLSACSCGWSLVEGIVAWPVVASSLLVGCAIFLFNRSAGGTLLLTGGVIASSTTVYVETVLFFSPLFFFLAPNLFFGLLLILGGLLAFPKTRHVIKNLHDGSWIP